MRTDYRRKTVKGQYALARTDFEDGLCHTIGLWIPGTLIDRDHAYWFGSLMLAGRYIGFTHTLAQDSDRRLGLLQALGQELATPVAAVGDVYYHIRDRRRLHDVMTAPAVADWPRAPSSAVFDVLFGMTGVPRRSTGLSIARSS